MKWQEIDGETGYEMRAREQEEVRWWVRGRGPKVTFEFPFN